MLPNKSGIEIVKSLRQKSITTPIIMLTAKSMLKDKIDGIKTGADDYLTKPFEYEELLVRVEAPKKMIEEQLWNNETFINSNVVSVTMHHLRNKIGKEIISNNRGLGYKLEIGDS